jgi:hypothetical protein
MTRKILVSALAILISSSLLLVPGTSVKATSLGLTAQQLINVTPDNTPINVLSKSAMSADGRYVVFTSGSQELVPGTALPVNSESGYPFAQVLMRDRQTNTTTVVSRSTNGEIANRGVSGYAIALSADGRFLLFPSTATNLGSNSDSHVAAIYVRDLVTGITTTASLPGLAYAFNDVHAISGDGNVAVYYANTTSPVDSNLATAYIYNRVTNTTTVLPSDSSSPKISQNGRYVSYRAHATVPASDDFAYAEYRYDITTGQTVEFSPPVESLAVGAYLSNDGNYAFYYSAASPTDSTRNLYVTDIQAGTTKIVRSNIFGPNGNVAAYFTIAECLSTDAATRLLSFCSFTDEGWTQSEVINLATGESTILSPIVFFKTHGTQLSADGTQVMFSDYHDAERSDVVVGDLAISPNDTTPPTISSLTWSQNPKAIQQSTTLNVQVSDDTGVASGEYFLGDADPGQGNGASMAISNNNLATIFGTDFQPGVYKVSVRAKDTNNNWSGATSDYLIVYDPNSPSITGKRTIVPSITSGDVLPGLNTNGQTDKAKFAFTIKYSAQGAISANSDLQFTYNTGTKCNKPALANNCHDLSMNAANITWLVVDGANQSEGIFQGSAILTIDGVTTTNPFRVTALDGTRLSPTSTDHIMLAVYAPGADPNTAAPIYHTVQDIERGNIKIRE